MEQVKYFVVLALFLSNITHAKWFATSNNHCHIDNPYPKANETATWHGACKNGYADGYGTLQWYQDGKKMGQYIGNYKAGKRDGKGVDYFADGSQYYGDYQNGNMHGKGVLTIKGEFVYKGDFKDDKMHGKGVMFFNDGGQYEGEFADDKFDGWGHMTLKNGSTYEGQWQAGLQHGLGKYGFSQDTKPTPEYIKNGYWDNNRLIVLAVFKYGDIDNYLTKDEYKKALNKLNK